MCRESRGVTYSRGITQLLFILYVLTGDRKVRYMAGLEQGCTFVKSHDSVAPVLFVGYVAVLRFQILQMSRITSPLRNFIDVQNCY